MIAINSRVQGDEIPAATGDKSAKQGDLGPPSDASDMSIVPADEREAPNDSEISLSVDNDSEGREARQDRFSGDHEACYDKIETGEIRSTRENSGTVSTTTMTTTQDAIIFATRVSITMALSSLFVLLPPMIVMKGDLAMEWPEASWVYVTAGVVSWQAGPDTAPVFKKLLERILGTGLGALAGLVLGFLSMGIAHVIEINHSTDYRRVQALFLALALPLTVFAGAVVATRKGLRGSYVSVLSNMTIGIVVLAFVGTPKEDDDEADDNNNDANDQPPWMHGVFRVINILIGCLIAGIVSSLVRPVPTYKCIESQINKISELTGDSVMALMEAAAEHIEHCQKQNEMDDTACPTTAAGMTCASSDVGQPRLPFLPTITDLVRNPETVNSDKVHAAYIASIDLWKECRQSLQLLRYDPIFRTRLDAAQQRSFQERVRLHLARLFRIQAVVVMMDSLLRGGLYSTPVHHDVSSSILKKTGMRIKSLLDPSTSASDRDELARNLIQEDLVQIRATTRTTSCIFWRDTMTGPDEVSNNLMGEQLWSVLATTFDQPYPPAHLQGQASLFHHLLEHVMLKAVRLHHFLNTSPSTSG